MSQIQNHTPGKPLVQIEGEFGGGDFKFPVAVLVQGGPRERERPWFRPEYKSGQIIVPDYGVIGGTEATAKTFMVIKMTKYWNVYAPRNNSERINPARVTSHKDLAGWTPERMKELGWRPGNQYDHKQGVYVMGQLAQLAEWTENPDQSDAKNRQLPPLATEVRDFLCVSTDGTLFFFRMTARRDTINALKLASTYVSQASIVPTAFSANSISRRSTGGDVFFGAMLQKAPGLVTKELLDVAAQWASAINNKTVRAVEHGDDAEEPTPPPAAAAKSAAAPAAGAGEEESPF